jgi:formiminotetrahydrofolate cyclodeaminase
MDEPFLTALAKSEPIPGGGAAAAYGGCVGLALVEKIIRVERQRPHIPPQLQSLWEELLEQVCAAASNLGQLRDEDGRAYECWTKAKTSGKPEDSLAEALALAIECPIKIMEQVHHALGLVLQAARLCKAHLLSDLLVSGELLMAAVRGSYHIAQANVRLVPSLSLQGEYEKTLDDLNSRCHDLFGLAEAAIAARAKRRTPEENR